MSKRKAITWEPVDDYKRFGCVDDQQLPSYVIDFDMQRSQWIAKHLSHNLQVKTEGEWKGFDTGYAEGTLFDSCPGLRDAEAVCDRHANGDSPTVPSYIGQRSKPMQATMVNELDLPCTASMTRREYRDQLIVLAKAFDDFAVAIDGISETELQEFAQVAKEEPAMPSQFRMALIALKVKRTRKIEAAQQSSEDK